MLLLQLGERPFRRARDEAELAAHGVHRERADSIEDAVALLELYEYDVLLIDLDLLPLGAPPLDHAAIRAIRTVSSVPIIALTTSPDTQVTVRALDLGADDVLTRLCQLDETLARIRAVVRRSSGHNQSVLRFGPLELSLINREVRIDNAVVRLGPKEYAMLELLLLKRGNTVTRSACLNHLYGLDDYPEPKIIDVVMCRLRKKLLGYGLSDMISNVWGFGFTIKDETARSARQPAPQTPSRAQTPASAPG